jgi:Fe-S-cluster containining protein
MEDYIKKLLDEAKQNKKKIDSVFKRLKKMPEKNLDKLIHPLHEKAFEHIDCLDCANCCSSISPILYNKDIDRIASSLRIKPSEVVEKYIKVDDDNDYVYKSSPCPFLMEDYCCSVYEARPKACREYPHTDRNKMFQILSLTKKNAYVCPAVYWIIKNIN